MFNVLGSWYIFVFNLNIYTCVWLNHVLKQIVPELQGYTSRCNKGTSPEEILNIYQKQNAVKLGRASIAHTDCVQTSVGLSD